MKKDNENNDKKDNKSNNFFNGNPLIVFALFSIVTIIAFKSIFTQDDKIESINNNIQGKVENRVIPYSKLKQLIKSQQIGYVTVGNDYIKALSKSTTNQMIKYKSRRVVPDDTLIPLLEKIFYTLHFQFYLYN